MKRKLAFALASLAGCASASYCQHTLLDMQVSKDGYHWGNSITVDQSQGDGARVIIRATVSWVADGSTTMPVGLASLMFQPVIANPRIGVDTVAPFASWALPGWIYPEGIYGPFGRLRPFTAIGPSNTDPYVAAAHTGNSGGAPDGAYYRLARSQVTRWMGTGATTGSAAVNNFNGAGGIACVQRSSGNVGISDPPFSQSISNVEIFRMALDTGSSAAPWTILVTAPLEGISRNTATGAREASWFASGLDNFGNLKAAVTVNAATITIVPAPSTLALPAGALLVRRRRGG